MHSGDILEKPAAYLYVRVPAETPHWNDEILSLWNMRRLDEAGSYIGRYVKTKSGVYRLVALAEPDTTMPATLDRVGGFDRTGTLYIGCTTRSNLRARLQQFVRSLRENNRGRDHHAGARLREIPLLRERFPNKQLAIAWSYNSDCLVAENNLLANYVRSFGEAPPLNWRAATSWLQPLP